MNEITESIDWITHWLSLAQGMQTHATLSKFEDKYLLQISKPYFEKKSKLEHPLLSYQNHSYNDIRFDRIDNMLNRCPFWMQSFIWQWLQKNCDEFMIGNHAKNNPLKTMLWTLNPMWENHAFIIEKKKCICLSTSI